MNAEQTVAEIQRRVALALPTVMIETINMNTAEALNYAMMKGSVIALQVDNENDLAASAAKNSTPGNAQTPGQTEEKAK